MSDLFWYKAKNFLQKFAVLIFERPNMSSIWDITIGDILNSAFFHYAVGNASSLVILAPVHGNILAQWLRFPVLLLSFEISHTCKHL